MFKEVLWCFIFPLFIELNLLAICQMLLDQVIILTDISNLVLFCHIAELSLMKMLETLLCHVTVVYFTMVKSV